MGLSQVLATYSLDYIIRCELGHFGFALLLGGSVFLASFLTLTILSMGWPGRRIFWLSLLLAFPFASMSHYVADMLNLGV
jgi:hypothetical protein